MKIQSINQGYSAASAAVILIALLGIILSYFLLVDAAYTSDWKETVKFIHSIKSCEGAERKAQTGYKRGLIRMYFSGGITIRIRINSPITSITILNVIMVLM